MKRSKNSSRKLRVAMRRSGNYWLARVANLSASGHNSKTARRLIGNLIEERYGHSKFEVDLALPSDLGAAVRKYREEEQQFRRLAESIPEQRLRCIRELLALNLTQEEVAELMGLTRGHLAVVLKRSQANGAAISSNEAQPRRRSVSSRM